MTTKTETELRKERFDKRLLPKSVPPEREYFEQWLGLEENIRWKLFTEMDMEEFWKKAKLEQYLDDNKEFLEFLESLDCLTIERTIQIEDKIKQLSDEVKN